MLSIRTKYFLGFVIVGLLLTTSIYLQVYDGIEPCPLCALQRVTFAVLGFIFFIGVLVGARSLGRHIVNVLAVLVSFTGVLLAGRQVWMQHFPPANSGECSVSLQYMFKSFPLNQILQKIVFEGGVECTKRGFEFLYLNMAEWALVWFVFLFILTLHLISCKPTTRRY